MASFNLPSFLKDRRQEEKGTTEDKMVGWHHRLNGHEFEQSPGDVKDREPGVLKTMGENQQIKRENHHGHSPS